MSKCMPNTLSLLHKLISDLWLCRCHLEITTSYLRNKFGVLQEEVAVLKSRALWHRSVFSKLYNQLLHSRNS